jgi:hypothetical protein
MPRAGFEPTIRLFQRTETDNAFERAVTVIGRDKITFRKFCRPLSIKKLYIPRLLSQVSTSG